MSPQQARDDIQFHLGLIEGIINTKHALNVKLEPSDFANINASINEIKYRANILLEHFNFCQSENDRNINFLRIAENQLTTTKTINKDLEERVKEYESIVTLVGERK